MGEGETLVNEKAACKLWAGDSKIAMCACNEVRMCMDESVEVTSRPSKRTSWDYRY